MKFTWIEPCGEHPLFGFVVLTTNTGHTATAKVPAWEWGRMHRPGMEDARQSVEAALVAHVEKANNHAPEPEPEEPEAGSWGEYQHIKRRPL